MYSLRNLLEASPARLVSFIFALLSLAAIWGLDIGPSDPEKFETSLFVVLTILAGGELTRRGVYSPRTVRRIRSGRE